MHASITRVSGEIHPDADRLWNAGWSWNEGAHRIHGWTEEEMRGELGAADGASGLGKLRSDARIDLLVTDVGLPGGMNGRPIAGMAKTVRPNLKLLFMTGYGESTAVGSGQLDRDMHVMTKPFAMEALASRIKSLIAEP